MKEKWDLHFKEFVDFSSIPLVKKLSSNDAKRSKLMWKIYILIALLAAAFMNIQLYMEYSRYHVMQVQSSSMDVITPTPAVTICAKSMTDGYTNLTIELEDFMYNAYYIKTHRVLGPEVPPHVIHHPYIGTCYAFNHGYNGSKLSPDTPFGETFSMENAFQKAIDGKLVTIQLNIRYDVHPTGTSAIRQILKKDHVYDPGFDFFVNIFATKHIRLEYPYNSRCTTADPNKIPHPYDPNTIIWQTYEDCIESCLQDGNENPDICGCAIPCESFEYYVLESSNSAKRYVKNMKRKGQLPSYGYCLPNNNQKLFNDCINNYLTLNIMKVSFETKVITEVPKMNFQHVLCSIGGNLGMLLGVSMLSLVEITTFIVGFGSKVLLRKSSQISPQK